MRTKRATLLGWLAPSRWPWLCPPGITPTSLVGLGLVLNQKGYAEDPRGCSVAKGGSGGMQMGWLAGILPSMTGVLSPGNGRERRLCLAPRIRLSAGGTNTCCPRVQGHFGYITWRGRGLKTQHLHTKTLHSLLFSRTLSLPYSRRSLYNILGSWVFVSMMARCIYQRQAVKVGVYLKCTAGLSNFRPCGETRYP